MNTSKRSNSEVGLVNGRSRSLVVASLVALFLIASFGVYFLQQEWLQLELARTSKSNLGFFLIINLNIVVVMILGFLVTKNIVKLVLDRRRNILGARLRSRLVTAFVGLSLIPTILLFLIARGMLQRGFTEWFSPQIQSSVDNSLRIAKYHYDSTEAQVHRQIHYLSKRFTKIYPGEFREDVVPMLDSYLEQKREEFGLFSISFVDSQGLEVAGSMGLEAERNVVAVPGINMASLSEARQGSVVVQPEQSLNGEFFRAYAPIGNEFPAQHVLIATVWILPEMSQALGSVVNAYDDYRELKSYRRPLASSYFLTLVVVTLLIVFGAIWVGFYLARDLAVPIGLLAEGTQQVAGGNLQHRIPELGDDELSVLVRSFNTMTKDLEETTGELVARRNYMETILASVGVGVVSINTEGRLTTCNGAALEMLGLKGEEDVHGKMLEDIFPHDLSSQINNIAPKLSSSRNSVYTSEGLLQLNDVAKHIQLTLTRLEDERGNTLGVVILMDDLTELVSAQRMAAWQEVARRIAHEIKNPLTPIQLCAERMQRRFAGDSRSSTAKLSEEERKIINDATETIVQQVDGLRNLVNEFSRFARMPRSTPREDDLNRVVEDSLAVYREAHPDLEFRVSLDPALPLFSLDKEQLGRVLVNLVDNAVRSVRQSLELASSDNEVPKTAAQRAFRSVTTLLTQGARESKEGVVEIKTDYDAVLGIALLTVADNGLGISESSRKHLFEPYFSDSEGGTGLGLAIVNTIVSDHNGFIRVKNNEPSGAVFVIELPVSRDALRKLA
jgi:two-component system nitrogen regulation sensor histidine kinase NtrY